MLRVRCIINSFGIYIIPLGALISQVVSCTTSKSTKVMAREDGNDDDVATRTATIPEPPKVLN